MPAFAIAWPVLLLQVAFWLCGGLLFYTFAGYHLLMWALARLRRKAPAPPVAETRALPDLSVVLVVYNEAERLVPRLENLLTTTYPRDKLELLVVSDGSTDATVAEFENWLGHLPAERKVAARILARGERRGKSACLNAGIEAARGTIVAFADARQSFAPETLEHLVAAFLHTPRAGAVSGSLEIAASGGGAAGGVDIYWRLEKLLRHSESQLDSAIGCTGAVYAIRKELYQATPEDTLVEDVVIPMRIAQRGNGWRVLFVPAAVAWDPQTLSPERERRRKQRTLAGNFQMLLRYPGWLLPWRNRLWWQLVSHKYLRLGGPLFLAGMLGSCGLLALLPVGLPAPLQLLYRLLLAGQLAFYALAALGLAWPGLRVKPVSLAAGFLFLNLQVLEGLGYLLRRRQAGW